jgi:hypothetical protein
MDYKNSRKEALEAGQTRYLGLPCKFGHGSLRYTYTHECVECRRAKKRAHRKKKASGKPRGRPKTAGLKVPFRDLPPEKKLELYAREREYWARNPEKRKAKRAKSRAKLAQRIPQWLTPDDWDRINAIYKQAADLEKQTPLRWEVDHIIPLNGKNVSGLHVPDNLRVIPREDNRRKSNRF